MCLGEVGRVVRLHGDRTAVVECTDREIMAALDLVLAEGVEVREGDVVIVSMGFVLAIADESELAALADLSDPMEARR
jgi:hydrogenase maturation factor